MRNTERIDPCEFFVIELTLLPEGIFRITLTGTGLDNKEETQLLRQKIFQATAASFDDALAFIKEEVTNFYEGA